MSRRQAPILGVLVLVLLGCAGPSGRSALPGDVVANTGSSAGTAAESPASTAAGTSAGSGARSSQIAAQRAIDAFNMTAGGPVSAQQGVLGRLVATGQQSVQVRCPAATSTISFDPVYRRLAPAPGWRPAAGTLPGTVYAVPTLIRIFHGDRITGTDLTDLHLTIDGGVARLPALCLA